jgi:large subunit ribosomal protein L1
MALIGELIAKKPSTAKGIYMRSITLSTTMSPGVRIDTSTVVSSNEEDA